MNNPNAQAPQGDNYQSHREFGRDLSNTGAQHTQLHGHQLMVHPILSTKAAAANTGNSGNNISIFKNFISQYQSNGSAAAP
jgi:hypothetical protein